MIEVRSLTYQHHLTPLPSIPSPLRRTAGTQSPAAPQMCHTYHHHLTHLPNIPVPWYEKSPVHINHSKLNNVLSQTIPMSPLSTIPSPWRRTAGIQSPAVPPVLVRQKSCVRVQHGCGLTAVAGEYWPGCTDEPETWSGGWGRGGRIGAAEY